jgi:hypothetical protein
MSEAQRKALPLFLISFATLFFEVLIIRWISSEVLVFAYFKNLVLLAAVIGLGLGCATGSMKDDKKGTTTANLIRFFPLLIAVLVGLLSFSQALGLVGLNFVISNDMYLWLDRAAVISSLQQLIVNTCWVVGIFILIVSVFDSLGQLLGEELKKHKPLYGYGVNLLGSLCGVLMYSLLACFRTSPCVWLVVGFVALLYFYRKWWQMGLFAACLVMAFLSTHESIWSPYYRVDLKPFVSTEQIPTAKKYVMGHHVLVNRRSFQRTMDMSEGFLKEHPEVRDTAEYSTYNMPYRLCKQPNEVLIIGAGSGNDVAAALRNGAGKVDAVEIDPTIYEAGLSIHPERPYKEPRVTPHITDGRAFLAETKKKYDLIVFGFVDSHSSFSMLSSVRLDNFLYTRESLAVATSKLNSDGVAALSFAAGPAWLRARLFQMVKATSAPQEPLALNTTMANPNSIIIFWGPGLEKIRAGLSEDEKKAIIDPKTLSDPVSLCTDDWPFLYQQSRTLSGEYTCMLVLLVLIGAPLTAMRFRLEPSTVSKYSQFFFLGAGFLLMETRAMLAISVIFGSTWLVNSIVIGLVLLMAMLANIVISKWRSIDIRIAYGALLTSLVILYLVPLPSLMSLPIMVRMICALFIVGLPFLFSGLVFSSAFSKVEEPERALGINILGAILGGCLEYLSVILGTSSLVLLAIVIYLLAALSGQITKPKVSVEV